METKWTADVLNKLDGSHRHYGGWKYPDKKITHFMISFNEIIKLAKQKYSVSCHKNSSANM